jgi:NitT/TauT family transport system substrate-binding protein
MRFSRLGGSVVALALFLTAACGSPEEEPEEPAQGASGQAGEPETTSFTFGTTGVGFSWTGVMSAIGNLNEQGWDIETPEISESALLIEGTARGEFQMSAGATNAVMLAAQSGHGVEIVTSRVKNEWTMYAKAEYDSCESLDGVRLAIHSEGSPATFMVREWIESTCPGTEPEYVIMPGSENRYAALISGEIDASPIELSDAITLQAEAGDDFVELANFSEDLPKLTLTEIFGNPEWMAENPNTVTAFITAILDEHERYAEDPDYLKEQALEHIPSVNADQIDAVAQAYSEMEMFATDGGLDDEAQQFTVDFFVDAGLVEEGVSPDDVFNLSYLEAARAKR